MLLAQLFVLNRDCLVSIERLSSLLGCQKKIKMQGVRRMLARVPVVLTLVIASAAVVSPAVTCDEAALKRDALALLTTHFDVELGAVAPGDAQHVGFQHLVMRQSRAEQQRPVFPTTDSLWVIVRTIALENGGRAAGGAGDRARRLRPRGTALPVRRT